MTTSLRGVILAGGKGTRLGELTKVTNKHLLPVGPYPMVYYPLKKLVGAGVRDILLISGTEHIGDFVELLGSGRKHNCGMTYRVQDEAGGIAQALALAEGFCAGDNVVVILGDNVFYDSITPLMADIEEYRSDAHLILKRVVNPNRYGVAETVNGKIVGIEEKPKQPKSDYAVTGVYAYPPDVFDVIRTLSPSERGELEITDVNNHYLRESRLWCRVMSGYWTDAGTYESLAEANRLVNECPPRF